MADRPLTSVPGIGEKTERQVRRLISRPTSRVGEVTINEAARRKNVAAVQSVLQANQQRALAEVSSFQPDRSSRQPSQSAGSAGESEFLTRGDFRLPRDDFMGARETFQALPDDQQEDDRGSREPVTTNRDLWEDNIGILDYPGVDTPSQRRPRAQDDDSLLTDVETQRRPREAWRESKPEQTDAQQQLGEVPEGANAERTGILRTEDSGTFVSRPFSPDPSVSGFRSANGLVVGDAVRDPTIGRDPDTGEFIDRPLDEEPRYDVPDIFDF